MKFPSSSIAASVGDVISLRRVSIRKTLSLALWMIVLWTSRADAAPLRVVLLPFVGPQSRVAEGQALKTIKKRGDLIPVAKWKARAKKLFATSQSAADVAAVSKDLGVDLVVSGTVKREGKWKLLVTVRLGKTGKSIDRLKYDLIGPRVPVDVLTAFNKELNEAIDTGVAMIKQDETSSPGAPASQVEPIPGRPGKSPTAEPAQPVPTTATTGTQPTANKAPPPRVDDSAKRPRWVPYFDLSLGAVIGGRNLSFDPIALPRFNSTVVGALYADVTVFPFAWSWKKARGVFAGLGLGINVVKPFWPASRSRDEPAARFATDELRVEGALRWRFTLYKLIPRPQLVLIAGGGMHSFSIAKTIDPSTMQPVDVGPPNTSYGYVSAGGGLRLSFAEWATFQVHAVGHFPLSLGQISASTRFGAARTTGVRVDGELDFFVYKGLKLGFGGFYEEFMMTFIGAGVKQANSAVDQYFGGLLVLGYVL